MQTCATQCLIWPMIMFHVSPAHRSEPCSVPPTLCSDLYEISEVFVGRTTAPLSSPSAREGERACASARTRATARTHASFSWERKTVAVSTINCRVCERFGPGFWTRRNTAIVPPHKCLESILAHQASVPVRFSQSCQFSVKILQGERGRGAGQVKREWNWGRG